MISGQTVLTKVEGIVVRKIGDDVVLVPVKLEKNCAVYSLNKTGTAVWLLINGQRTINEIVLEFCTVNKIKMHKREIVRSDIFELLEDIIGENLAYISQ